MTLSHRNRTQNQRLAGNTFVTRSKRSFEVASLCVVAAMASVGGFAVSDVAAHHDDSCFPVNQNTRSIQMIESKEAPVATADDDTLPSFVVDENRRSILLIEGKQAPNTVAEEDAVPAFVVDENRRSILLIEGKEAPVATADDDTLPSFVVDENRRSILLIEGKEAPLELAQPGS